MRDLSKEIRAYALRNALEFGRAEPSKILPKLFQHGLQKSEIKEIMPKIKEIVDEVNSLSKDKVKKLFSLNKNRLPCGESWYGRRLGHLHRRMHVRARTWSREVVVTRRRPQLFFTWLSAP